MKELNCMNCRIGDFKHSLCDCDSSFYAKYKGIGTEKDFIDALTTKWIPTSHKLPIPNSVYEDVFVYYLVQNEYGDMMVATFVQFPGGARVWRQMYQDEAIMEDIVAWRPLPTPWKGEEP